MKSTAMKPAGGRRMLSCVAVLMTLVALVNQIGAQSTPEDIKQQIEKSRADVDRIIDYTLKGAGRHATYNRLALLGDTFGHRLTGSQSLEDSINYILRNFTEEKFDNPHGEELLVPRWTRGNEWATLITEKYNQSLPVMALGYSVGIDVVAQIVVVKSFDELEELQNSTVSGKIVVYNYAGWQGSYGETVRYRREGAQKAAEKGAAAALIRSVTEFSIASPHTGTQAKDVKIPGACISVEDAEMLQRMYDREWRITIHLHLEATNYNDTISRNVVAEIQGSEFPNSTVIFGGHIDTWDVTHGSMDDGGGVMIAWQALSAINALGIKPRRTIRLVLWTAEEQGLIGGIEYFRVHQNESDNVSLIIESDAGAFKPRGIGFTGSKAAQSIMEETLRTFLSDLKMTSVKPDAGSSSDTGEWVKVGVPGVELFSYNEEYFHWHHTFGDAMTVLNADDLDHCTILWATIALTVANLDDILPRSGDWTISGGDSVMNCSWHFTTILLAISVTFYTFLRKHI